MFFTINRKKTKVTKENGKIKFDEKEIRPVGSFILPATLKKESAYVVVETSNKTYYLKSISWLEKENDTSDDQKLVNGLNKEVRDLFRDTILFTETFEALVGGKFEAYDIYSFKGALYAPEYGWKLSLNNIDVVFFERLTSYTKTFDITLIYKDKKIVHLSNIYRKKYLSQVELLLKDETVYKTGPDPVDWDDAKTKHYDNGVAWEHVIDDQTEDEVSEEEWVQGETDEEESDDWADFEEDEDELREEMQELSGSQKRKLDDEWDTKSKVLHSDDYDRYEKRSRT